MAADTTYAIEIAASDLTGPAFTSAQKHITDMDRAAEMAARHMTGLTAEAEASVQHATGFGNVVGSLASRGGMVAAAFGGLTAGLVVGEIVSYTDKLMAQ